MAKREHSYIKFAHPTEPYTWMSFNLPGENLEEIIKKCKEQVPQGWFLIDAKLGSS